jgi:hypothetical protein
MSKFEDDVLRRLDTIERKLDAVSRNIAADPNGRRDKGVTAELPASVLELLGKIADRVGVPGHSGWKG